jgi:hypothetical protein
LYLRAFRDIIYPNLLEVAGISGGQIVLAVLFVVFPYGLFLFLLGFLYALIDFLHLLRRIQNHCLGFCIVEKGQLPVGLTCIVAPQVKVGLTELVDLSKENPEAIINFTKT